MFTGIIETMATVQSVRKTKSGRQLDILVQKFLKDMKDGSSVAIDGVCLTVIGKTQTTFRVDVIEETLSKTTLSSFAEGRQVNLEKPLLFTDRFDGHFVQGHIDGTAEIVRYEKSEENVLFSVKLPKNLLMGIIKKGSVSIDGISLTVADLCGDELTVALIPYTLQVTTMGMKMPGDKVNIETDVIGKYVARYFNPPFRDENTVPFPATHT
jgi:riboflavin synthase